MFEDQALWKTAIHESGHALIARYFGIELGGATVVAGNGYRGLVWGPDSQRELCGKEEYDALGPDHAEGVAEDVARKLKEQTPAPGDDQSEMESLFIGTRTKLIELMAGEAAERLIFPQDDPSLTGGDLQAALAISGIVCRNDESRLALIEYSYQEALEILREQRAALLGVARALMEKQTLDQAEIDVAIREAVANEAFEAERERRTRWRKIEANAARFASQIQ